MSSLLNAQKIHLMTEVFPPFQYKYEDKLIGISTDIVNSIQREIGIQNKIQVLPWSKAISIVDTNKNSAIFSMLKTPERENKYKWVGPLASMKLVFFKKKGSPIELNDIEDAKNIKRIGVTKGVANFEMLSSQGFQNLTILNHGNDEQNIQKLVNGEIDLWPTLLMAGFYNARRQGLAGEIVPIRNVVAFSGDMYIAFNLNTDDKIIQRWQNALNKIKRGSVVEDILRRYEDNEKIDYSLFIKIFLGICIILIIIIYHNRQLSRINNKLKKLQKELQVQADRDPLTNLYNRRYFNSIATQIMNIGKRKNHKTSIIMIDIDRFKLVNDTYGHSKGDYVLKELSSLLNKNTRQSDIVARFGGEEFIILLPDTNINGAFIIAQKIRENVESLNILLDDNKQLKFTISLGIAMIDHKSDIDIEPSIKRADKALYEAKETGRNRIVVSKEDLV